MLGIYGINKEMRDGWLGKEATSPYVFFMVLKFEDLVPLISLNLDLNSFVSLTIRSKSSLNISGKHSIIHSQ